jgi:hypothetical protein
MRSVTLYYLPNSAGAAEQAGHLSILLSPLHAYISGLEVRPALQGPVEYKCAAGAKSGGG